MKISAQFAIVVVVTFGSLGLSQAQQAAKDAAKTKSPPPRAAQTAQPAAPPAPAEAAPANAPAGPGWVVRCNSASRDAPLECGMEESAVLTKTGQLVALVNIRVPGDTKAPIALIQLPLGINLPVGAKLGVDDGKTIDLQVQTCEARGCYVNTAISPDMLAAMKSGKLLKVSFQNMSKETITIPMPLADFAPAYDKIK